VVLWTLLLLSLIAASFLALTRGEIGVARNAVDNARAEALATDSISIGDYVLTGGEIPAMVVVDAVVRLLPGVLGDDTSSVDDSFATGLLEGPTYTRPSQRCPKPSGRWWCCDISRGCPTANRPMSWRRALPMPSW